MRVKNILKEKLSTGNAVLGTWQVLPSPAVSNIIAASGFDFTIIDMEHGPVSFETAENMIRAIESENSTPLIRVPKNDESDILRALEIGANGIIVPQVNTEAEALRVVKAVKYHPAGQRGFSPFTRSAGYIAKDSASLSRRENGETFVGIIVEDMKGINNLKEIVDVPGLDLIYLGKYDLSQSLDVPGDVENEKVKKVIKESISIIKNKNITVGSIAGSESDLQKYKELGIGFIAFSADCALLSNACSVVYEKFKNIFYV